MSKNYRISTKFVSGYTMGLGVDRLFDLLVTLVQYFFWVSSFKTHLKIMCFHVHTNKSPNFEKLALVKAVTT